MQKPCEVIDRDVQRGNRTDGRSVSKRVLPHSVEAEQSVIGSMLMDRDAIIAASEIVVADDFYQRQYGIMFDTMVELFNEENRWTWSRFRTD